MKSKQILTFALIALLFFVLSTQHVLAQDSGAAPETVTGEVTADEVNTVAKELWCPLCSNIRLDACELRACEQMKDVIADKLSAGESTQNIKDYFVQQYGPQVLGAPPLEGFNWLAWILPVVVLVGGGYFLWSYTRKMMRKPATGAATATSVAAGDPYSQALEKELKQYD